MLALILIANSYNKARSKYKHFMGILRSTSHQRKTSSLLHQWKRANNGPIMALVIIKICVAGGTQLTVKINFWNLAQ